MKKCTLNLLFICLLTLFFACSKDDEKPNQKEEEIIIPGIAEGEQLITVPDAMKNNQDSYAQMAVGYIEMANAISTSLSMFDIPPGAVHSTTPITPTNGRLAGNVTYKVYTWSDNANGYSVAYQVGEKADGYTFEMFVKSDQTGFKRLIFAEENKAKTIGKLIFYDITSATAKDVYKYEWIRNGDLFNLKFTSAHLLMNFDLNTKTGAGTVKYYSSNKLEWLFTWNANGSGTWVSYNTDGEVKHEGSWN